MADFLKFLTENPAVADSLFWTLFILVLAAIIIPLMIAIFHPSEKNKPPRSGGGFVEF
ncbi:hypothetical protein [Xanthomonas phage RTH11]|nr:hypothetical protein [Xanthomonas phage RTH11]